MNSRDQPTFEDKDDEVKYWKNLASQFQEEY